MGTKFWDLALREHAAHSRLGHFDDALSSFFRNVDTRDSHDIPVGDGQHKIATLKARAVLVDMEEGVLNQVTRGPLAELFDCSHFIKDVSGSGNNWSHGHEVYGPQYHDQIMETIRTTAEQCDSLQSFFMMHSMGGGTGSGLGTYILEQLADHYSDVYRFTTAIFPSADDDVVTSPYNAILSLEKLILYSDCVLPVENQALMDIVETIRGKQSRASGGVGGGSSSSSTATASSIIDPRSKADRAQAYDDMNTVAAHVLTNLTSSMRFNGALNVDLNEITMNLVPYPRMHFLVSQLSPFVTFKDMRMKGKNSSSSSSSGGGSSGVESRSLQQTFNDALQSDHCLIKADPKRNTYLAMALMVRGNVQISDINRNIQRMRPHLDFIHWNPDGFKIGLCSVPPVGMDNSVLCLSNNLCINEVFTTLRTRMLMLYKRAAHLHHYTEYMEQATIHQAVGEVSDLIQEYTDLQTQARGKEGSSSSSSSGGSSGSDVSSSSMSSGASAYVPQW
jgi:tubulin epsilon